MSQPASGRVATDVAPAPQADRPTGDTAPVPEALGEDRLALALGSTAAAPVRAVVAEPQLDPPGTPGTARGADVGAFASVRFVALFSSAHALNGWAMLDGIGWRRYATTNASAHVNLGLLGAAARVQGTPAPVRHEADNQIHEIYVW